MYPYTPTAQSEYNEAPSYGQPGQARSTIDSSTLSGRYQADYVGTHPTVTSDASVLHTIDSTHTLAFPNAPWSHDADHIDGAFIEAVCRDQFSRSYQDKRALLSGVDMPQIWNLAVVALGSKDATPSMLRDRLQHTRRLFNAWRMSKGITTPAGPHSSETTISSLCQEATSAIAIQDEEWIRVLLQVFGQIPELWYSDPPVEAGRSGSGVTSELFGAHDHSRYSPQGIPLAPQRTASTAFHAPALTSNIGTTAFQFPAERSTSYSSSTAAGESRPWRQGSSSLPARHLPSVPGSSPQSQFDYQPAHPENPATSESGQDASMFPSQLSETPFTDNPPDKPINPFDLSAFSKALQSIGEHYSLPEMGDLDEAATLLRGGEPSAASQERSMFMEQHKALRLSSNLIVNEILQNFGGWQLWYLEFLDNAAFMGLPTPTRFQAEQHKMTNSKILLSVLYASVSREFRG